MMMTMVATIHRKSPSKKTEAVDLRFKKKGFVEEDEDATTGVTEGKTQNRKNRKKGRVRSLREKLIRTTMEMRTTV